MFNGNFLDVICNVTYEKLNLLQRDQKVNKVWSGLIWYGLVGFALKCQVVFWCVLCCNGFNHRQEDKYNVWQ